MAWGVTARITSTITCSYGVPLNPARNDAAIPKLELPDKATEK